MTLVVGGDYHHTDSDVSELRYSLTNVETGPFIVGGTERLGAAYARATITATDALTFELGGRGDWWKSEPLDAALPTKSLNFFSPRASVAWRAGRYAIKGAVYHASRTPTLNELHRGFRAGNVVTNPNPLLEPEILTGFEVGVLGSYGDVSLRGTVFFTDLDQAIANITLTSTAGADHAAASELRLDSRPGRRVRGRRALEPDAERGRADRVHVEPLPRLGGNPRRRRQRRAAGARGAGRLQPHVGGSALVHRRRRRCDSAASSTTMT